MQPRLFPDEGYTPLTSRDVRRMRRYVSQVSDRNVAYDQTLVAHLNDGLSHGFRQYASATFRSRQLVREFPYIFYSDVVGNQIGFMHVRFIRDGELYRLFKEFNLANISTFYVAGFERARDTARTLATAILGDSSYKEM